LKERRTEDAEENQEDGRRHQTHENGGETHIVAVVETKAASIEARQREANMAEEPCLRAATNG
jgi:hypothetical protein